MDRNMDLIVIGAGPAGLSAACAARACGLDVYMRPERHHRQLLPQLRQQEAGAEACRGQLAVRLRRHRHRKILPGMRQAQARRRSGRLDLHLRKGQQR